MIRQKRGMVKGIFRLGVHKTEVVEAKEQRRLSNAGWVTDDKRRCPTGKLLDWYRNSHGGSDPVWRKARGGKETPTEPAVRAGCGQPAYSGRGFDGGDGPLARGGGPELDRQFRDLRRLLFPLASLAGGGRPATILRPGAQD